MQIESESILSRIKLGINKNISRIDLWKIWKDVTAKPTPESSTAC